jgi:hypothetical protein
LLHTIFVVFEFRVLCVRRPLDFLGKSNSDLTNAVDRLDERLRGVILHFVFGWSDRVLFGGSLRTVQEGEADGMNLEFLLCCIPELVHEINLDVVIPFWNGLNIFSCSNVPLS